MLEIPRFAERRFEVLRRFRFRQAGERRCPRSIESLPLSAMLVIGPGPIVREWRALWSSRRRVEPVSGNVAVIGDEGSLFSRARPVPTE